MLRSPLCCAHIQQEWGDAWDMTPWNKNETQTKGTAYVSTSFLRPHSLYLPTWQTSPRGPQSQWEEMTTCHNPFLGGCWLTRKSPGLSQAPKPVLLLTVPRERCEQSLRFLGTKERKDVMAFAPRSSNIIMMSHDVCIHMLTVTGRGKLVLSVRIQQ